MSSSVTLLIAALFVTQGSSWNNESPDVLHDLGILQTVWLTQKREDLQSIVENVDVPTTENLRKAGMVPVRFAMESESEEKLLDLRWRKRHLPSGSF